MVGLSIREKAGTERFVCFKRIYTEYSGVLRRDHYGGPALPGHIVLFFMVYFRNKSQSFRSGA